MGIMIPKRLENHLRKEDKWHTCVTMLKGRVEKLLTESPEFFPDYTVHGIGHINEVLTAADKLIIDAAFRDDCDKDAESGILEPMDVAYLVCAILIHDLGMFLHQDGVRKLTTGEHSGRWIKRSGDAPWRKLWQEYTDRTKAFSRERMHRHFGKLMQISDSSVEKETMDDDDKRIIGEFLRQNHGRLAHEIAMYGLPGSVDIDLFHNTDLTQTERDLIGLLARSHTMAIRDTEQYLKDKFEDGSMPENTPVFFLMSVLRIADLLDAGDHRAPELLLEHQRIHVPISQEEWQWNQRIIRSKCKWNLKQKSRHIYAEPTSSTEYVQLDKWLRWVQTELDLCWSILAERYPDGYKLSIHRVTSRIYQPDVQKTMNEEFLTREVKVTASPEVTRLLIAPLYGNDPSYGVRELLQNAVDACLEREYKETDPGYKGLVTIRIDPWADPETGENRGIFTIEDNGIGMNEDVLLNYYLSAGASYRSSEAWKQEYAEGGQSQVARTGKFGVGFLAAFLLGDSISVVTQHRNDALGYSFTYTNQSKPLNIVRVEREQGAGTTITIPLKKGVWGKLENDRSHPWYGWYAFDEPEVRYFFDGIPTQYEGISLCRDPQHNEGWFELKSDKFDTYLWKPHFERYSSSFFCNGICVDNLFSYPYHWDNCGLHSNVPDISLIDTRTNLDVNLARSMLQSFPDEAALAEQICRYHISRLLMTTWNTEQDLRNNAVYRFFLSQKIAGNITPAFLLTPDGFALNNSAFLSCLNCPQYLILCFNGAQSSDILAETYRFLPRDVPICVFTDVYYLQRPTPPKVFTNGILNAYLSWINASSDNYHIRDYTHTVWVHDEVFSSLSEDISLIIFSYFRDNIHRSRILIPNTSGIPHGMTQLTPDYLSPKELPIIHWEFYNPDVFPLAILVFPPNNAGDTLFAKVLRDVLEPAPGYDRNDIWIPFDMEERKKKFPKAFRELAVYMDAIRKDPEAHHVNI